VPEPVAQTRRAGALSPRRGALAFVVLLAAVACSGRSSDGPRGTDLFIAVDPASASPTDRAIVAAQARLRANSADDSSRVALAQAFLQKTREVGDPTLYPKVQGLLEEAQRGRTDDAPIVATKGALALARHDFGEALKDGRRALELAPGNSQALGVVVDALNELGRYGEALDATQAMVDAKPALPSLARVSYARELRGDLPGAVAAMAQAVTAGAGSGENLAYTQVLLGNLLVTSGDLAGAEAAYAAADRAFPGFVLAKAGQARAAVARGDVHRAADVLGQVVRVLPTADHAISHGDALAAAGRADDARQAYDLVRAIARLYAANGVKVDLELALFEADHGRASEAVTQARRALRDRPSILAHDALAWSLFRAGKGDEAWSQAERALQLGTRDPQLRYHAAAIAFGRGDRETAARHLKVVLETNPRFSAFLAPNVAELARGLGLTPP